MERRDAAADPAHRASTASRRSSPRPAAGDGGGNDALRRRRSSAGGRRVRSACPPAPAVAGRCRAHAHRAADDRLRRQGRGRLRRPAGAPGRGARADRPVGLRQDDAAALAQPAGRADAGARRATGGITLDGEDVDAIEVTELRRRVSMVFQQPNPFPMSIFDNVAYALREQGSRRPSRDELGPRSIDALERAGLYDEVQGRPRRTRRCGCRAGSSSACASRARWRRGPRCCCSTSRAPRSTRARPRRSRS